MTAIIGHKAGMTRTFSDNGKSLAVTVIEVPANRIAQIKTEERDGYNALQLAMGQRKRRGCNLSLKGHFSKAELPVPMLAREVRCADLSGHSLGDSISLDGFAEGQLVDVTGISKGKGFQGGIKRWNFGRQDATHGNSLSHRSNGSIGQCQTPGRVFKGKKMSGHMGHAQVTVQNLKVVKVDTERGLIMVGGAVPGAVGAVVQVSPAVKAARAGDSS